MSDLIFAANDRMNLILRGDAVATRSVASGDDGQRPGATPKM